MGATCSRSGDYIVDEVSSDIPDREIYELLKQSVDETQPGYIPSQHHLLFRSQQQQQRIGGVGGGGGGYKKSHHYHKSSKLTSPAAEQLNQSDNAGAGSHSTRLLLRRHTIRMAEEGFSGTHIYAMRWAAGLPGQQQKSGDHQQRLCQEQCPRGGEKHSPPTPQLLISEALSSARPEDREPKSIGSVSTQSSTDEARDTDPILSINHLFQPSTMASAPKRKVVDWVTVSEEHNIFIADVGLTNEDCNHIVGVTEQVCKGQYAAYTYAKQTLGCREFPPLAVAVQDAVHSVTHAIMEYSDKRAAAATAWNGSASRPRLALDEREPHMVKYDVTRRERQKLDMHTDKSEWTFLISLSNGCGMDFTGGGTFFECLDATVHVQRGHALIFPGKLRHCGQRITSGLRFLLVGFLVDKTPKAVTTNQSGTAVGVGIATAVSLGDEDHSSTASSQVYG